MSGQPGVVLALTGPTAAQISDLLRTHRWWVSSAATNADALARAHELQARLLLLDATDLEEVPARRFAEEHRGTGLVLFGKDASWLLASRVGAVGFVPRPAELGDALLRLVEAYETATRRAAWHAYPGLADQVHRLIADADSAAATGDWERALARADLALALEPANKSATEISERARDELLAELLRRRTTSTGNDA